MAEIRAEVAEQRGMLEVGITPSDEFYPIELRFLCDKVDENGFIYTFSLDEMVQVEFFTSVQTDRRPYSVGDSLYDNCTSSFTKNYCVDCYIDVLDEFKANPELPKFQGAIGARALPFNSIYKTRSGR